MVDVRIMTRVLLAVAALVCSPAADAGERFSFVVIGGGAGDQPLAASKGFVQARDELNFLRPAFVVNVGNAIPGPGNAIPGPTTDKVDLEAQWDAFEDVRLSFISTHFLVVGDRDVFDAGSQRVFQKRYGPLWYAFNHGSCRFIVLDSEVAGQAGMVSGEQRAWLEQELKRHADAAHTFVFLHRPIWLDSAGRAQWFAEIHPLLAQYGVDVVFAGHWPSYVRSVMEDGVRYYVTGGVGPMVERSGDALGACYLWVSVNGDEMKVGVIRSGWLGPDTLRVANTQEAHEAVNPGLLPAGWDAARFWQELTGYLTAEVMQDMPEAKIEVNTDGMGVWNRTQQQSVTRPTGKAGGETEVRQEVGPLPDGVMLTVFMHSQAGSSDRPETVIREPWQVYLGQVYIPQIDQYLMVNVSYGSKVDASRVIKYTSPDRWLGALRASVAGRR